ncbi:hypothetical protein ACFVDQ_44190 [Streptomyces sp. NPDC057684]|uniref:hypothetical protein n=1 Tax=Streptomyces sp. NPDC057684 TaxID=3346211 RepID=UPI0036A42BEE
MNIVPGQRLYPLTFFEQGTRTFHITGVTSHPAAQWATQQARHLAADLGTRRASLRSVLHDRYGNTPPPSTPSSKPRRGRCCSARPERLG